MRFNLEEEIERNYKPRSSWEKTVPYIGTLASIIDYCTSDNQLEGQEYAREFAASLYSKVINELAESIKEIDAADDRSDVKLRKHIEVLRTEYDEYKNANILLERKMEQALSRIKDPYYDKLNLSGGTSITAALGYCIMTDPYYTGLGLDDKMEKKRKKYFLMSLAECLTNWEEKVSALEKKKSESLKRYKNLEVYRTQKVNELSDIVKQERNKFTNNFAKYKIICIRESR